MEGEEYDNVIHSYPSCLDSAVSEVTIFTHYDTYSQIVNLIYHKRSKMDVIIRFPTPKNIGDGYNRNYFKFCERKMKNMICVIIICVELANSGRAKSR